jgi:hypothetical protein
MAAAAIKGRTANRRDRAKYNAYMREYMRLRYEAAKLARYDPCRYPVRSAFRDAVGRTIRARRWAAQHPELKKEGDERYGQLDWQYEQALRRQSDEKFADWRERNGLRTGEVPEGPA